LADSPIRVGVVGLGAFGGHHARHYAAHPGALLVAVADVDIERARKAAATFGGEAFADHRALIGKVDAVSIAVPASLHHAVAGDFIDAGVHVLIEKPIAATSAEARDLVARADRSGVVLQVGHVERFSPAVDELKLRLTDLRRISSVRRTTWSGRSADVDVILDLMIHDIDMVLMLAGTPVTSVAASGASVKSGVTDEAEAWLTFPSGLVATLSASRVAEQNERKLQITEAGAVYVADLAAPSLTVASRSTWRAPPTAIPLLARDSLGAEIAAFLRSIATGAPVVVDGRAGLAALEVAERIQAAIAESGKPAKRSAKR
jgi:predicted dehydrogenase